MKTWNIMCGDRCVAVLEKNGIARILDRNRMPYDLWFDEETDIDTLVNNITNFNYWCAKRMLTLDREYAKEILDSIGASQGKTDRERAAVALSYHCLNLTDIYWVKSSEEDIEFPHINLYENHLDNAFVDIALRGRTMTVENAHLIADDVSTSGVSPKAWIRREDGFYLYKDGKEESVRNEILASRICRCFECDQVLYEADEYDGYPVSVSRIMTGLDYSITTRAAFDIYALNNDIDPLEYILGLDSHNFYMMNILDYLVGNTDRHWENWGFLIDNSNGRPVRLHDLMDFNHAFKGYDTIEGGLCQTLLPRHISQKQAAIEAVQAIGLNQICDVDYAWFEDRTELAEMFGMRLGTLLHK